MSWALALYQHRVRYGGAVYPGSLSVSSKTGGALCFGFLVTLATVGGAACSGSLSTSGKTGGTVCPGSLTTLCKICGAVCLGYQATSSRLHHYRVESTLCEVDWSYDTLHGKHKDHWFDDDDFNIFFAEIQDVLCPDFHAKIIRRCLSLAGSNLSSGEI